MKPFEFIQNILLEDQPKFDKEFVRKNYPTFYVNVVLGSHMENIFLVQAMNEKPFIDIWAQYLFYFYGCDKMYRIPFNNVKKPEPIMNDEIREKIKLFFPDYSDKKIDEIYDFVKDDIKKVKIGVHKR